MSQTHEDASNKNGEEYHFISSVDLPIDIGDYGIRVELKYFC